jgi:phage/plasmid-like protein (TIGR03299 family)
MPDAVTSMAYNTENGPPWHRKGTPTKGLTTAAECIKAAGLDWAVTKVPLRIADEGGVPLSHVMATVRADLPATDSRRVLGIVGEEYQPLQNWDAFRFFDGVVGEGAAIYETAGAIENGKRIWLLAKIPTTIHIGKDDVVDPYLLLANGHDGQLMVHVKFTPVRVVCQNTLAMALHTGGGPHLALRHDRYLKRRLESAADTIATIQATLSDVRERWSAMASHQLVARDAERYFRQVFGARERPLDNAAPDESLEPEPTEQQRPLLGLKKVALDDFEREHNRKLRIDGTLWAAYNAAVYAIDFGRKIQRDRVDDLCLAEGAALKARALRAAEKHLEAR